MISAVEAPRWVTAIQSFVGMIGSEFVQTLLWINHLFKSLSGFDLIVIPVALVALYFIAHVAIQILALALWAIENPTELLDRVGHVLKGMSAVSAMVALMFGPILFLGETPYVEGWFAVSFVVGAIWLVWLAGRDVKRQRQRRASL